MIDEVLLPSQRLQAKSRIRVPLQAGLFSARLTTGINSRRRQLVDLLFALHSVTPLVVCRSDTFVEQAEHQYRKQALFVSRCTHPRPHTWFVSKLPPELDEDLQGLCPSSKTQPCELKTPPQSQAQAALSFHKKSLSFPLHVCSASDFLPCKTSGFSIRPSPDALSRVGKSLFLL